MRDETSVIGSEKPNATPLLDGLLGVAYLLIQQAAPANILAEDVKAHLAFRRTYVCVYCVPLIGWIEGVKPSIGWLIRIQYRSWMHRREALLTGWDRMRPPALLTASGRVIGSSGPAEVCIVPREGQDMIEVL